MAIFPGSRIFGFEQFIMERFVGQRNRSSLSHPVDGRIGICRGTEETVFKDENLDKIKFFYRKIILAGSLGVTYKKYMFCFKFS